MRDLNEVLIVEKALPVALNSSALGLLLELPRWPLLHCATCWFAWLSWHWQYLCAVLALLSGISAPAWRNLKPFLFQQVVDVEYSALKAVVQLSEPFLCESQVSTFTLECVQELLELKERQVPLQELWVVYDDSGEFDQTALAVEHVR